MNRHTLSLLKSLIAVSNDGEYAFRVGVRRARSAELAMTFACLADNCQQAARELQKCVVRLGGPVVADRGPAAFSRITLGARRLLAGNDDLALLQVCQLVQQRTVLSYRKAVEQSLPAAAQALIERQYRGAQLNHVRIRDLLVMHQSIGPISYAYAANIVALRAAPGRTGAQGVASGNQAGAALQKRSMA